MIGAIEDRELTRIALGRDRILRVAIGAQVKVMIQSVGSAPQENDVSGTRALNGGAC